MSKRGEMKFKDDRSLSLYNYFHPEELDFTRLLCLQMSNQMLRRDGMMSIQWGLSSLEDEITNAMDDNARDYEGSGNIRHQIQDARRDRKRMGYPCLDPGLYYMFEAGWEFDSQLLACQGVL